MIFVLPENQIREMLARQLESFFLPLTDGENVVLNAAMTRALERCDLCFRHSFYNGYHENGVARFNPFHTGQYTIFLYFVANSLFRAEPGFRSLAERVYYLNKALNGVELYFEVELPAIFMLDHPLGSVIGRAKFGDYFSFTQNCTVGNNKNRYPTIGRNVHMHSGSKVLGSCEIGDNVVLAANTYVIDSHIPSCSLVFGASPHLVIKSRPEAYFLRTSEAMPPALLVSQAADDSSRPNITTSS